jgi:DNA-binding transcriptional regulator LsrR (DeoR family)
MLQKDISNELEMTRVQTHRAIQSLIERDIVTSEDHFNTKKITLADWLIQ